MQLAEPQQQRQFLGVSIRPRTWEQCMAQAAFICDCRGPSLYSQTALQRQPQPLLQQVAAARTLTGTRLRLQAHAYSCQRAANRVKSDSHIARAGLQAVKKSQRCSSSVGCCSQSRSDNSQVPSDSPGSVPPSNAAEVCKLLMVNLMAAHHAPDQKCICRHI